MLSDQQKILLKHLKQQPEFNVPGDQILILLDCIEAPNSLQEMGQIAGNLIHIIPYLVKISPDQFSSACITNWINTCTTISEQKKELTALIPDFFLPGRKRPKTGYIKDHPLYYALWPTSLDSDSQDFFCHLQAHFLCSVIQFKEFEKLKKQDGYQDIRKTISNHIRNHLHGDLYSKLHEILPSPPPNYIRF